MPYLHNLRSRSTPSRTWLLALWESLVNEAAGRRDSETNPLSCTTLLRVFICAMVNSAAMLTIAHCAIVYLTARLTSGHCETVYPTIKLPIGRCRTLNLAAELSNIAAGILN